MIVRLVRVVVGIVLLFLGFAVVCIGLGSPTVKFFVEGPVPALLYRALQAPIWTYYNETISRSVIYRPEKRRYVSTEERAAFEKDGVVVLPALLNDTEWSAIGAAGQRLIRKPSLTCVLAQMLGVGGYFLKYEAFCQHPRTIDQGLLEVATESAIAHAAQELLLNSQEKTCSSIVRLLRDTIMVAGDRMTENWHFDRPVFFNGTRALVAWCPAQPIQGDQNGLLFINGSHRVFADTTTDHFPRIMPALRRFAQDVNQSYAPNLEAGDCLFFQDTTVHSAAATTQRNLSSQDQYRIAYQLRFFISDLDQAPRQQHGWTWAFHPLDTIRATNTMGLPKPSWPFIYPAFLFEQSHNLSSYEYSHNLPPHATISEWIRFAAGIIPRYLYIVFTLKTKAPLDIPSGPSSPFLPET